MQAIIDPKESFGLKKESYMIDPVREANGFIAHNKEFADSVVERFSRSLVTGRGPKLVLIHLYGDGKTHVMKYACSKLEGYSRTVFITCPVMSRASKYMALHYGIMIELKDQRILTDGIIEPLWADVLGKAKTSDERRAQLEGLVNEPDLATAVWAYKEGKADFSDLVSWLSSSKPSAKTLSSLQIPVALDSLRATKTLVSIATLYRKYNNKVLILFIDNADNLTEARAGARDFKEAFRLLADAPDLGLVITINVLAEEAKANLMDNIPSPLRSPDVMSRMGASNYEISPPHMQEGDVDTLVIGANKWLADPEKRPKILERAKKEYGGEISPELYPFTKSGYKAFKTRILAWQMKSGEKAKLLPRDVLRYIDDCIGQAALMNKKAIDEDVLTAVGEFRGVVVG